jgi:site-specific DNA recombinase
MRALIYARVSYDPEGRARSVKEQEDECRTWARREGWDVVNVVRETGSASRYADRARSQWPKVVAAVESKQVDLLLTWEFSRATRDLSVYTALRDACARAGVVWGYGGVLHDLNTREARFRTGLDALLAEDEAARTSERVQRAMRASAQSGRPHGKRLYGYRRIYDSERRELVRVEPEPAQAAIVQEAAKRVLAGESCRRIALDFQARGIPPRRPPTRRKGAGWSLVGVREMLLNPAYAGLRVYRSSVVGDAIWPPLLTLDERERLIAILTDPARSTRSDTTVRHLLSGIAECGVCESPLRMGKQSIGRPRGEGAVRPTYMTYLCRGPSGSTGTGFHVCRRETLLDEFVTAIVLARLDRGDVIEAIASHAEREAPDKHGLALQMQLIGERLASARSAYADGELPLAGLIAIEKKLQARRVDIERRVRQAAPIDPIVIELSESHARTAWNDLSILDRRRLIRALLVVRVHPVPKDGRGRRGLHLESIDVDWKF